MLQHLQKNNPDKTLKCIFDGEPQDYDAYELKAYYGIPESDEEFLERLKEQERQRKREKSRHKEKELKEYIRLHKKYNHLIKKE